MSKLLKMFGAAVLIGVLMMVGGCGGGDDAVVVTDPSTTSPIAATVNPNGTATTGATATTVATATGTTGYLATVSATLDPSTVITAKNAAGEIIKLTAAPSITFTAPADSTATSSGVHGIPVPAGVTLASTSGAIRLEVAGAASATFVPPITIKMPVPGKADGSVIKVYQVDGTTWKLLGNYTATGGFVSVPMASFTSLVGDPATVSGSGPLI